MTRDEAINTLKEIKITLETYNSWSKTQSFSEYPQALEKAIFALSAESATLSAKCAEQNHANVPTDLISRADAVKAIYAQREFVNAKWYGGMSDAIDIINDLPSVSAKEYLKTIPTVYLLAELGVGSVEELMAEPTDCKKCEHYHESENIEVPSVSAYKIVFDELTQFNMFRGIYDAKNGSRDFINGVGAVMEAIAYKVSEENGEEFTDLFVKNNIASEEKTECASAEPTTRERKEAKSTLMTLKHLFEDEEILKALDVAIECVSAEPKHGEWIRKEKEENDCDGHRAYYWYECSECGAKPPKNAWKQECFSPYCPNCGAKMKGGD